MSAARSRRKCSRPSCCGSPATRRASSPPPAISSICADFLTYRATGSLARSACTVACKWLYLARERRWPQDFFAGVGLEALGGPGFARIGAEIVAPGTALGRGLAADAAARVRPAAGRSGRRRADRRARRRAGDFGRRARRRNRRSAPPRSRWFSAPPPAAWRSRDEARFIPGVWGPHYSALTPGQWLVEGGQSAFGAAIDRLMRMSPAFAGVAGRPNAFDALEREIVARAGGASQAARLARDLHVLPDFLGNRSPYADPAARGAIVGLDLRDDEESAMALYVAGLCGLAQGLAQVIRAARGAAASPATRSSPAAARRAARLVGRSSPTRPDGRSPRRRPASRCCSARRCSARSPPGGGRWSRR